MTQDVIPEATGADEPERPASWRQRVRGIAVDTTPLRESPEYRRLFFGESISTIGTQMTAVAVPIEVYEITRSSLHVGLLGFASLVPLIVFGLIGGSIADSMDRRRLMLITSSALAVVSFLLFLQAVVDLHSVLFLYVLVFCQSALFAVDSPARRAVIPRLLTARQIPAATALSQVMWSFATIVGPLVAGLVIATLGVEWAYGIDAVSFAASLYAAMTLRAVPPEGGGTAAGVGSVMEGLRYLRTQPVLLMTFVIDIVAMVFGMPRALFPEMAERQFHGGSRAASVLYAAIAAGALLGALFSGRSGRVRRQGLAVLVAVVVWGFAIVGFGFATAMWVAVLMLAVAGAADMVSAVFRNSILQVSTPDAMRGRLSGVFIAVVAGGPRLGDVESGTVSRLISTRFAVVSGGVACVVGTILLGLLVPSFRRYEAPLDD